jgi:hypothetical protein
MKTAFWDGIDGKMGKVEKRLLQGDCGRCEGREDEGIQERYENSRIGYMISTAMAGAVVGHVAIV